MVTASDLLNSTGSAYFLKAVPGLNFMAPLIFETVLGGVNFSYTNWTTNGTTNLTANRGALLNETLNDNPFKSTPGWTAFFYAGLLYLMVAGAVFGATGNTSLGLISGFPILAGGAYVGLGDSFVTFVLILVIVAAVIFGILFILGRMG